ncbi:MAG: PepSY domain-containing protein, partial [Burkholderiales bacterium]
MQALVLIHRWLGVAFCLLFSMWFATGVVMHFVPYPTLTEAERVGGLAPIGAGSLRNGPAAAVAVAGIDDAARVHL